MLQIPGLLHLEGLCFDFGTATYAGTHLVSDAAGLDVFEKLDSDPAGRTTVDPGFTLQVNKPGTHLLTIQAGTGVGTQTGQRLATITIFQTVHSANDCFFQLSALYQTT